MARIPLLTIAAVLLLGLDVAPAGAQNAYITNSGSNRVSVIATPSNTVTDSVAVGGGPAGVAVTPSGNLVYVANGSSDANTVSVISTATNTVVGTITVGVQPFGV